MPKIPVYERTQSVNPEPQLTNTVAGKGALDVAQSYQELGKDITKAGQSIAEIQARRDAAEANDYGFNQSNADETAMNKFYTDNKANYDGFSSKVAEEWQKKQDAAIKNAPSEKAADTYRKRINAFQQNSLQNAYTYERTSAAAQNVTKYGQYADQFSNDQLSNPDFSKYDLFKHKIDTASVEDTGLAFTSESKRFEHMAALKNQALSATYTGLFNSADSETDLARAEGKYKAAMTLLNSDSQYSKDLDPKTKATLMNEAERGLKHTQERRYIDTNKKVNDVVQAASDGLSVPNAQYASLIDEVKSNPKMTSEEKSRVVDTITTAQKVSAEVKAAQSMPSGQWAQLSILQPDNKIWNRPERQAVRAGILSGLKKLETMREEDGAQAAMLSNPGLKTIKDQAQASPESMQNYQNAIIAEQQRLGIPKDKIRVSTKSDTANFSEQVNTIINQGNPAQLSNFLDSKINLYGPLGSAKLIEESIKDKNLPASFYVVSHVEDKGTRQTIINNMNPKNAESINNAFKVRDDVSKRNLDQAINSNLQEFLGTINSSGDADMKLGNGFHDAVSMEAKRLLVSNTVKSEADAATIATQKIVSKNFDIVKGHRSAIVVSKSMSEGKQQQIANFLEQSFTPEELQRLNTIAPAEYKNLGDKGNEMWISNLRSNGRWIMTPDNQAFKLVYDNPITGNVNTVGTQQVDMTGNKLIAPVIIPIEKINSYTTEAKKRAQTKAINEVIPGSSLGL